jgi:hypothetical protein
VSGGGRGAGGYAGAGGGGGRGAGGHAHKRALRFIPSCAHVRACVRVAYTVTRSLLSLSHSLSPSLSLPRRMILFSQVIGLAIEAWKLSKAFAVKVRWGGPGGGLRGWLPQVDFSDRDANYATSRTKEYDDIATHHMLVVLVPLVLGYASYSLVYERHRSWYSWLLTSAVNYVYLFGFVQLVPQLYIKRVPRQRARERIRARACERVQARADTHP